jgi:Tfp pilus assembly protein PilX
MDGFSRGGGRVHGSRPEQGVAMIATLITLIVLAVMVVIMFNTLSGSPSSTGTTTTTPGETVTPTTAPVTPASGAQEAAVSACEANFQAIQTALGDYRALNGSAPAAGTAWATSSANGGPLLQSWPESAAYYSITWNGEELSVIPVRGAPSHGSDGTSSPKSGCFAA